MRCAPSSSSGSALGVGVPRAGEPHPGRTWLRLSYRELPGHSRPPLLSSAQPGSWAGCSPLFCRPLGDGGMSHSARMMETAQPCGRRYHCPHSTDEKAELGGLGSSLRVAAPSPLPFFYTREGYAAGSPYDPAGEGSQAFGAGGWGDIKPVMRWLPSQRVTAHPESTGNGTAVTGARGRGAAQGHGLRGVRGAVFLWELSVPLHSARAWGWLKGAAWVPSPAPPLARRQAEYC